MSAQVGRVDPDTRAIYRRRRQDGRCVACALRTPRATLCPLCRVRLCWCPRCETLWESSRPQKKASTWCPSCHREVRRQRDGDLPRSTYLTRCKKQAHPLLSKVIALYRTGLKIPQIAEALHIKHGTLRAIISHARKTGRWPKGLQRFASPRNA